MVVHPVYALTRRRECRNGCERRRVSSRRSYSLADRARPSGAATALRAAAGRSDSRVDASPSSLLRPGGQRKKAGISTAILRGTDDFKAFRLFPEPFQRFSGKSGGSERLSGRKNVESGA
jgi:hypothetical protein